MTLSSTLRGVLAAALALATLPVSAITSRSGPKEGLTIVQTFEPQVRAAPNESLPSFGDVRLVLNVDENGKLIDWLPISYAHPAYLSAAVDAIKGWEYRPAKINGEPVSVRQQVVFSFQSRGRVVSMLAIETANSLFRNVLGEQVTRCVYAGRDLDEQPKPIKVVQPLGLPPSVQVRPGAGVMIDFYIDENGHPRMPTVSNYDHPVMAAAAVQALEQWEFTPPKRNGQPVAVRVVQWFSFAPSS